MTTFEQFVSLHNLSLFFERNVRTMTEVFGPGEQLVREVEEWTCQVRDRSRQWEIRVFKKGRNEFIRHLPHAGKTQADARQKLAEAIKGGVLNYTPGERKERIEIQIPDDLE